MSYPNQDDENNTQEKDSQLKAQKEMMLKQVLSSEARLRLKNVRMVKPDLADLVENYILTYQYKEKFLDRYLMSNLNKFYHQPNNLNVILSSIGSDLKKI